MKIRTGFVSNSSSSSFCLWGISKETSEMRKILADRADKDAAFRMKLVDSMKERCSDKKEAARLNNADYLRDALDDMDGWELPAVIESLAENGEVFASGGGSDGYYVYFGLHATCVRDDETGAQFKARGDKLVSDIMGAPTDCGWEEEGWRDG
jgi:hypothetical protein